MSITDRLEIFLCRLMIWRLRVGYGERCETDDIEDFPELRHSPEPRCPCCRAWSMIDFLEEHISLIKD